MSILSHLFSRRDAATVPSMDGMLRPNDGLERASVLAEVVAPDNLVPHGENLLFSSGKDLFSLGVQGKPVLLRHFDTQITALAVSAGGKLAIGLDGVGACILDGTTYGAIGPRPAKGPTAMAFLAEDTLLVCIGSAQNAPEDWQRDVMEMRATGSVWRVDLATSATVCLADGLAFPNGILIRDGKLIISESWGHRVLRLDLASRKSRPEVVLEDLPGYPGRLSQSKDGGVWLAIFAPRSQLVEFVLRERAYCARMLREISPDLWIAPSFRAGVSFREPMQGGAVRVHGVFKPWAPTRSYGLAVQLDKDLVPVRSFHSRADGGRHGVVSVCEWNGSMVFASRGGNLIAALQDTPQ